MSIAGTGLLLLWLVAAPTPVIRQQIVVTAARDEEPHDQASAAVTLLDRQEIERLPASSLAELLAFVPGVTMLFDSGASGLPMVTSRGFFGGGEVEYLKLIVDGVPVGDAESGNVDWQRFRSSDIERLEVLHGPGSALYGDTALGGVVQVFTSGSRADPASEVRFGAGSFGALELGATHRAQLARGHRVFAAANAWATDGFRENADADGRDGRFAVERLGDRWHWRLEAEAERRHRRQPGALSRAEMAADRERSDPLFRFDGRTSTRGRIGAAISSFGRTPVRATFYGIRREDDDLRTLLLAPGFGTSAFRSLTTNVVGGTFEVSRESAGGVLRAGTDLERAALSASYAAVGENGEIGERVAGEDGRRDRAGFFATGGWTVGARYRVSAGLRRDDIRDDLTSTTTGGVRRKGRSSLWSPRLGLNVRLGPEKSPVSLFLQASRAFKAPTLDQLYDPRPYPDGRGGSFTISNPELRPQRAWNLEAGLSRATRASDWALVFYRMRVRNEIDFDPRTFTYRNLGTSLHRGVEASASLAKGSRLAPRLTYSWTRVADAATPHRQLKNIPEHSARLLLRWRITARASADFAYRWRDGLWLDDDATFQAPPVSRLDFRLSHDFGGLRLHLDVLNALDARYSELGYVLLDFAGRATAMEFPAPGRAVRIGAKWTFRDKENR